MTGKGTNEFCIENISETYIYIKTVKLLVDIHYLICLFYTLRINSDLV